MELLANRIGGEAPAIDTPDRPARQPGIAGAELLAQVLDQIDYGLLLVGSTGALRYANHLAMEALSARGALLLQQRMLRARAGDYQVLLADALADAQHGRRRLITLGKASTEVSLALDLAFAPDG